MKRRNLYLALCVAGVIVPDLEFGPWLLEHGLNLSLFFQQLLANRVSGFFGADVAMSAVTVFVFAAFERPRLGVRWYLPVVFVLLFGVSAGLPLLLYLREGRKPAGRN